MSANPFDLNAYIDEICQMAKINPKSEKFIRSHDCSITLRQILKIIIIQNWNPFRYPNANFPCKGKSDFAKLLNNFNIESGLPSAEDIVKYLLLNMEYFDIIQCVTDFSYGLKINSDINAWLNNGGHLFIYEESDTGAVYLAHDLGANRHCMNLKSEIYCNEYDDELLHALFFGCQKGRLSEFPKGNIGLIQIHTLFRTVKLINFQAAGENFRHAVLRYINQGSYTKYGEKKANPSFCNIVCTITAPFDKIMNSMDPEARPDLQCKSKSKAIFLYPLRYRRADIPIHLYLHVKRRVQNAGVEVSFPSILLRYWLLEERWNENYGQLRREINEYISKFVLLHVDYPPSSVKNPEERKKLFFDLISIVDNTDFKTYISKFAVENLEPYELISSEGFVEKPYFYFALRHFNKSSNCLEILEEDLDKFIFDGYWLGLTQFGDIFKRKNMAIAPVERLDNSKETESKNIDENKKGPSRPTIPQGAIDLVKTPGITNDSERRSLKNTSELSNPIYNIIVAEVADDGSVFPKIKLIPEGQNQKHEVKLTGHKKAWISILVYLIYERTNRDDHKNPKVAEWGLRWEKLIGKDEYGPVSFRPLMDICRWFGYFDDWGNIKLPSWWTEDKNLGPTTANLQKIFEENGIFQKIFESEIQTYGSPIHHLNNDLKARIDKIKK